MIAWLEANAVWLGALGAIVGIVAIVLPLFKRDKPAPPQKTITADNSSVAADRIENTEINIGASASKKSDG